ncbi:MAG: glycoside hydrolase family 13 protein [Actinomycetota bacterium]|nr:glycoside hydrolase family 13 protein [Actinomycetota bacterium]
MPLAAPPLPPAPPSGAPWWRDAVIYQVYPRSFADSDGDGVGDLPGATARLAGLRELGVDAVWFSPFYVSPQNDAGYDVADYRDVDPLFGTLADVDALLAEARRLGLRVIVDLVPNHTSSEHPWFRAALAAPPGSRERARYLFRPGTGPDGAQPPNDWRSVFGGPAWSRVPDPDGRPGEWYLHLFDVTQPDLDWTHEEVRAEFEAVLRFWLDRGVDGFRVDVAHGLVKAEGLPDWDCAQELLQGANDAGERPPFWDQEGVHEVYRAWRTVLDSYDGDRMAVAEAWVTPPERLLRYVRPDELQQAFNFDFLLAPWEAPALREVVTASLEQAATVGAPTTWVLSNHDVVRHATRLGYPPRTRLPNGIGPDDPQPDAALGLRRARAATLVMLALPGSAYLYQGEELGLPEHTTLDDGFRQDPVWIRTGHASRGRDGCRVPLPWSAEGPSLGFGPSDRTWLPQPDAFRALALDVQRGVPGSTYEMYREALRQRRALGLGAGTLAWVDGLPEGVLAFRNGAAVVLANLSPAPVALPPGLRVLLTSGDLDDDGRLPVDVAAWTLEE